MQSAFARPQIGGPRARQACETGFPIAEAFKPRGSGVSKRLRQPPEESAPRSPLRRTDSDPCAIADLILLVKHIDHVETCNQAAKRRQIESLLDASVDLRVIRQVGTIGRATGRSRPQTRTEQDIGAEQCVVHRYEAPPDAVKCCSWSRSM